MKITTRGCSLPVLFFTTVLALSPPMSVRAQVPDSAAGPGSEVRPDRPGAPGSDARARGDTAGSSVAPPPGSHTVPDLHLDRALHGAGILAGLLAFDESFRRGIRSVDAAATDELADRAEWFGDWQAALPFIAGGALGIGGLTEDGRGLKQGLAVLAGTLAGSAVNETINRAVGRSRPYWNGGVLTFRPFNGHASFPSGHTSFVFGLAGGIDAVTDGWVPAATAYGVAGLTGLSRTYHDRHWLTDVVAGATVGLLVSRHVTARVARALGADATGTASSATPHAGHLRPVERGVTVRLLATPTLAGVQLRF